MTSHFRNVWIQYAAPSSRLARNRHRTVVAAALTAAASVVFGVPGTFGHGVAAAAQTLELQPGGSASVNTMTALTSGVADVDLSLPALPGAGGGVYAGLDLRRQINGDTYRARVKVVPGGDVVLGLRRINGGADAALGIASTVAHLGAGQVLHIEAHIAGTSTPTLLARAWTGSGTAPAWQQAYTDNSTSVISAAGLVGMWSYLSGSTPAMSLITDDLTGTADPGASGFTHPGVLLDRNQLDFVKSKVAAGAQPWTSNYNKMLASPGASDNYAASPVPIVDCGAYNSPDTGCTLQDNDARAAYTQALLWYYTGQTKYALKSVQIMNAWSGVLQQYTNTNAPLQAAWAGEMFPRAAEIIRYTSNVWAPTDVARFSGMLINVMLPAYSTDWAKRAYGSGAGNWELSMADARINIGVFTDNRSVFDQGVATWRARVPAYIYLPSDGALPVRSPGGYYTSDNKNVCHWLNRDPWNPTACPSAPLTTTFASGQTQETCRDYVHVGLGFASMLNAAETARMQAVDLYGEQRTRIVSGLEYNSLILNTVQGSTSYPSGYCTNSAPLKTPYTEPTYEIGYQQYANRDRLSLPQTLTTVRRLETAGGTGTDHQMAWETLTSAGPGTTR